MNLSAGLNLEPGKAICYSGFREGQSPETQVFPTYEEIKEELQLFDEFMNKAVSANIPGVNVLEIVSAYNKIRTFINENLDKEK